MLARNISKNSVSEQDTLPKCFIRAGLVNLQTVQISHLVGGSYDSMRGFSRVPASHQIFATVHKRQGVSGDSTVGKSYLPS